MGMSRRRRTREHWSAGGAALLVVAVIGGSATAEPQEFVAGTAPDRRPESAPRITTFEKSPAWYALATAGISQPYPPSLKFLDNQGAWFTPFIHPGMGGPYDIRGLRAHRPGEGGNAPPSK